MRWLTRLKSVLWHLLFPTRAEVEMDREVRSHIDLLIEENQRRGMTPGEAARHARIRFRGVEQVKQRIREGRHGARLERICLDLRYAVRSIFREPRSAGVVIMVLGVGIGVNTAVFTPLNAILLKPVDADSPDRLRALSWTSGQRGFAGAIFSRPIWDERIAAGETIEYFSFAIYEDLRDRSSSFSELACWYEGNTGVLTPGGHANVRLVSGNYFRTLGIDPLLGRPISDADQAEGNNVAVLSHRVWQRQYGGDPSIVTAGRTLNIRGTPFEIVGVMRRSFVGIDPTAAPDVLVPYAALSQGTRSAPDSWVQSPCRIFGRLSDSVSDDAARAEAEVLFRQAILAASPSEAYELPQLWLKDVFGSHAVGEFRRGTSVPLLILMGATSLILLITCVNIAALLLSRAAYRRTEIATPMAIGGSRPQIVSQLLAESVVQSSFGGVLGVALAYAFSPLLPPLLNSIGARFDSLGLAVPIAVHLAPDWRVFAFSSLVAIAAGITFGIVPAVRGSRIEIARVMRGASTLPAGKSGNPGPGRLNVLVVTQVALSMVLLVAAGLFVRTLYQLVSTPMGYDPDGVVFATVVPDSRQANLVEETLEGLNRLPGVEVTAVSRWPLFNNATGKVPICVDPDVEPWSIDLEPASGTFFEAWGIPIVQGETFEPGLTSVAMANETFAKTVFGDGDPIGRTVYEGDCSGTLRTIVGVVADHTDSERKEQTPMLYIPFNTQVATTPTTFSVRATGQVDTVGLAFRGLLGDRGLDVDSDIQTGTGYRNRTLQRERVLAAVLTALALFALGISCLGIYGTVAYALRRRVSELGLRLAFGATRGQVILPVVARSLVSVVTGIVVGLITTLVATRWIETLLFEVDARDPLTLFAVVLLFLLVGTFSSLVPALAASRLSPLSALRHP